MLALRIGGGILTAIGIFVLMCLAEGALRKDDLGTSFTARIPWMFWLVAAGCAVVIGAISVFSGKMLASCLWVAPILMAIAIAALVALVIWWWLAGSKLREFLWFFLLDGLLVYVISAQAQTTSVLLAKAPFWASVINVLPWLLGVTASILMIVSMWRYCQENSDDPNLRKSATIGFIAVAVLCGISIILLLIFGVKWSAIRTARPVPVVETPMPTETPAPVETPVPTETPEEILEDPGAPIDDVPVPEVIFGYYNLALLEDDDPDNDFNLGPNLYKEGWTAQDCYLELYYRTGFDPVLGAMLFGAVDKYLGTDYLGLFYSECEDTWDAALNAAAWRFIEDPELYKATREACFSFLDTFSMKLEHVSKGLHDQVYINPYTVDGVPLIIVAECGDVGGTLLTFTKTIPGKNLVEEFSLRTDCGGQLTNCAKKVGVTPQASPITPSAPSTPGGQDGGRTGGTVPTNGGTRVGGTVPSNDPTPRSKDPSRGTQGEVVGAQDDPTPGPDTNNPGDPRHSIRDEPSNSDHMTIPEYDGAIGAIEGQRGGGDPNAPTAPTPPNAAVDNDGATGNGGAPVDASTPTAPSAHDAEGGSVNDNPDGEEWDSSGV